MAVSIHDFCHVPIGGAPAAPVFMGMKLIENKPATFHFGIAKSFAAAARHLAPVEREIHMLGSVAVLIVDIKGTLAVGKCTARIGVRAATFPVPAITARIFRAVGAALPLLIGGPISPLF